MSGRWKTCSLKRRKKTWSVFFVIKFMMKFSQFWYRNMDLRPLLSLPPLLRAIPMMDRCQAKMNSTSRVLLVSYMVVNSFHSLQTISGNLFLHYFYAISFYWYSTFVSSKHLLNCFWSYFTDYLCTRNLHSGHVAPPRCLLQGSGRNR